MKSQIGVLEQNGDSEENLQKQRNKLHQLRKVIELEELDFDATPKGQTLLVNSINNAETEEKKILAADMVVGKLRRSWQLWAGKHFNRLEKNTTTFEGQQQFLDAVNEERTKALLAEEEYRRKLADTQKAMRDGDTQLPHKLPDSVEEYANSPERAQAATGGDGEARMGSSDPEASKRGRGRIAGAVRVGQKTIRAGKVSTHYYRRMIGLCRLISYDLDGLLSRKLTSFAIKTIGTAAYKIGSANIKPAQHIRLEDYVSESEHDEHGNEVWVKYDEGRLNQAIADARR